MGSRTGHCQLALKEHQDFPKEAAIISQIRTYPNGEIQGSFHLHTQMNHSVK